MSLEIKPQKCTTLPMKLRRTTETVIFGVGSLKSLKGQENLLLKNLSLKTCVENVQFLSRGTFFVAMYSIQSTNEMSFNPFVRNRTNLYDRKGSAEKWSAYICMSLG